MLTNTTNIDLALAVWLANSDEYDLVAEPNTISVTTLLKPIRAIVLAKQYITGEGVQDISTLAQSALGTSIHASVEKAWTKDVKKALQELNYPKNVVESIVVNPGTNIDNAINIYVEQRTAKEIEGFTLSGKYDLVIDGELNDIKTTSTYTWTKATNSRDYILQGSMYRWLNPTVITKDYININFLFTDWKAYLAKQNDYPSYRIISKKYKLMELAETELYIRQRLKFIKEYLKLSQAELPRCTPKELWQELPTWAYYKNPKNLKRATKVFHLENDAYHQHAIDGGVGIIKKRESVPKRCGYCEAFAVCDQAQKYVTLGILK